MAIRKEKYDETKITNDNGTGRNAGGNTQQQCIGSSPRTDGTSGNEVQPRYVNTANIAASLKIEGSTAYAHCTVTAKKVCHVNVKMRLQRWTGSEWFTVCSWVEASDKGTKTITRSFPLTTRGTYRVYTLFNVGGEELSYTSVSKTY